MCIRYRYDEPRRKRLKTVELIVDEIDWEPGGTKMRGETLSVCGWAGRSWNSATR